MCKREGEGKLDRSKESSFRWFLGMCMASIFTVVYMVTPMYLVTALACLIFSFPSSHFALIYAAPMILSFLLPSVPVPFFVRNLTPVLDFFEFEIIGESSPINPRKKMMEGTNYIVACQPHGVISFCAICSAIAAPPEFQCKVHTAVASAVLRTPILKHVMGVFGLIDATKANLVSHLKQPGVAGSVVLYVGGMAELFMSSRKEERLFLSQRKGFIKLALTQGVDVVPVYLFGNTSVLTVVKTGLLARLSRRVQVSLTFFLGKVSFANPTR